MLPCRLLLLFQVEEIVGNEGSGGRFGEFVKGDADVKGLLRKAGTKDGTLREGGGVDLS